MTESAPVLIRDTELEAFVRRVMCGFGMRPRIAEFTARFLVATDLRGVDSHGISMLPRYVHYMKEGYIDLSADPVIVSKSDSTALIDAQRGLGHYAAAMAMDIAIAKCHSAGISIVTVRRSNHFGAAALYSMMALKHDMIGICTTNVAIPAMVPTHGRTAMLGTNPISIAVPAASEGPFVLDMATTTVALGKIQLASRKGQPLPEGWALDNLGRPQTDAQQAFTDRLLCPLGGYKGYGLAVMVDILSGVLGGAVYGNLYHRTDMAKEKSLNVGHCFIVIDPARFRPIQEFKADMDDMLRALKASPKAEGADRIYTAGEIEAECAERRKSGGIPIGRKLFEELNSIAASVKVEPLTTAITAD